MQRFRHFIEVIRDTAHNCARLISVEESERHFVEFLRDLAAELQVQRFGKARHQPALQGKKQPRAGIQCGENEYLQTAFLPSYRKYRSGGDRLFRPVIDQIDNGGAVQRRDHIERRVQNDRQKNDRQPQFLFSH